MDKTGIDFEKAGNELTLHPRGRLDRNSISRLWQDSKSRIQGTDVNRVIMDLQQVQSIDSSGVVYFRSVEILCQEESFDYAERNIPENLQEFLEFTRQHASLKVRKSPATPVPGTIAALGLKIRAQGLQVHEFLRLFGQLLLAATSRLRRPGKFHLREFLYQFQAAGVRALWLIAALSFLLGMVMVFQSTTRSIGIDIFVADVVVLAVTREMAPFLVAVVVAGRSGSAFASEIGTMKVNEELDALTVMNIDVPRFIVLPRVLALATAEPFLTMFANLVGILGGLTTASIYLNVPATPFLNEARGTLRTTDIFTGLLKSVTTGLMTGFIACFDGLKAGREPGSVGVQTTAAVVQSIFGVILVDTVYSYIFSLFGW